MPRIWASVPYSSSTPWMASTGQAIRGRYSSMLQARKAGASQTSFQPQKAESASA